MSDEMPAASPVIAEGSPGSAAVAGGSAGTVAAAVAALSGGGNAVDAVIAAAFASAVAEPTLSSVGGGGFLLVREPDADPVVLDFFVDVPGLGGNDVQPAVQTLSVTYGSSAQQTFHVGWGTIATPGCFAGYLDAHRRWGRLPLTEVLAPAIAAARDGVALDDALQARIREAIRAHTSPRHVPARIVAVADIPRTLSGKTVELAVREVVHGRPVANTDALANPAALELFRDLPELRA